MAEYESSPSENLREDQTTGENTNAVKPAFVQPKVTFVKPELVKQGAFAEVTGQFFGTFFP